MAYETPDEKGPAPARAYVYSGEWVADCTRPGCGCVEFLFTPQKMNGPRVLRKPFFACSNCGQQAVIDWPGNQDEILLLLRRRPIPQTRNWYPQDHPVAVNFRIPHGQTLAELISENEEHGVV